MREFIWKRTALAVSLLLPLAGAAAGQSAPQETPPAFGEVIEVRVINLEVVVTDRDGLPVTGLGAADFRLRVDGEEVPIGYFTEVRNGTAAEPGPEGESAAVPTVPELVAGSPVGTSYLVFIDDFFSIERDRNRVLRTLIDDLPRLGSADRMAIVSFDGQKLALLSSWSGSASALERALKKATERPANGLQRVTERRSLDSERRLRRGAGFAPNRSSALLTQLDLSERYYAELIESQLETVVSAAAATLRGFAQPPGRKVMILLSGGWPYDPAEYVVNDIRRAVTEQSVKRGDEIYRPVVDTANRLGYTLYTVDVPGLGPTATDSELDAPLDPTTGEGFLRENNLQYSLAYMARQTGGRALLNTRRLEALERAAVDTRSYYWLGFTPGWKGDDQRHKAAIEVLRPGLKVRSRSGYLDSSRQREVSMRVESALLFGGAGEEGPLALQVGKAESSGIGKVKVPIALGIPVDRVTMLPTAEGYRADLELRVAALDDHGGRSEVPVIPITISGKEAPEPGKVARYDTTVVLRREKQRLLVAVYDPATGALLVADKEFKP